MPPTESKSSSEIWLKCPKAQLFSNTKLLLSYVESHFINKRLQTCKSHSSSKNSMEREKKIFLVHQERCFTDTRRRTVPGGRGKSSKAETESFNYFISCHKQNWELLGLDPCLKMSWLKHVSSGWKQHCRFCKINQLFNYSACILNHCFFSRLPYAPEKFYHPILSLIASNLVLHWEYCVEDLQKKHFLLLPRWVVQ